MPIRAMLKTTLALLVLPLLLASTPALAGETTHPYDTELRMVFGFGHGKSAVKDEAFAKFAREVLTPAYKDGMMIAPARGQWMHPQRGLIQERNAAVYIQYVASPEAEEAQNKLAQDFLKRFPGSNAAVYMLRMPIKSATIFYQ